MQSATAYIEASRGVQGRESVSELLLVFIRFISISIVIVMIKIYTLTSRHMLCKHMLHTYIKTCISNVISELQFPNVDSAEFAPDVPRLGDSRVSTRAGFALRKLRWEGYIRSFW